jgi:osmoprotectant transport system permease protein
VAQQSGNGASGRPARAIDRVAAAGAVLALAAALFAPLVVFRANRIVSGRPLGVLEAGPTAWLLVAFCVLALAAAIAPSSRLRGPALLVAAAGVTVALALAVGQAAERLTAGASGIARVSLGAGAWLLMAGAGIVWFAASKDSRSGVARAWAGALTCVGLVAVAVFGGLSHLSIVLEYTAQADTFWQTLGTHVALSATALAIAVAIGVPLGVLATRLPALRAVVLGVVGVVQTVPSLALLGLLIVPLAAVGLPGIGPLPATIALTVYALLPIVRNTYVGLTNVDPAISDAGRGMGMSGAQLLLRVEAPLALPLVIEGVRSAAVLVIGIAAVVAFIGVGTLGVLVFEGWGQQADDLILLGAVPMVVLAVVADWGLRALARAAVSPGLRQEV